MPEPDNNKSNVFWIASIGILFIIAFWQSWSGVFVYILGWILGSLVVAYDENKRS